MSRVLFPALTALLALVSVPATAQALTDADDAAIRKVVLAVPDAYNRLDWKAYADLFADDADWINVVGMHWAGKADVVRAHEAYGPSIFRNGGYRVEILSLRAVAPGVAIVVATEHVDKEQVTPGGTKFPPHTNRPSYVLVKRDGEWEIVLGHNTTINVPAQSSNPIRQETPE